MMREAFRIFGCLAAAVLAANLLKTEQQLEQIEHSVIRLHILAASDSTADQVQKLLVRDAVLAESADWFTAGEPWTAQCEICRSHLPEIQAAAEAALRETGCTDTVKVAFGETDFPAREYGGVTLPAGQYQAVRIEIGAAEGQNWWCVMYPAMCIPAAAEGSLEELLDTGAYEMTEEPERYEVRLKCVEAARAIWKLVRSSEFGIVATLKR